jgi:hypothetical protein
LKWFLENHRIAGKNLRYLFFYGRFREKFIFLQSKKNNMEFKPSYFIMTIRKFAEHYSMTSKQAYQYLKRFAGIAFLDDCFEAEHTLSFEDAIEDLTRVCQNHGGYLKYA